MFGRDQNEKLSIEIKAYSNTLISTMSGKLTIYRDALAPFITTFLETEHKAIGDRYWSDDVFLRLKTFATRGKLLRGSLFLASYALFSGKNWQSMLPLATALELMQSALLIHDDIIDNDLVRRNKPSVMAQYEVVAQKFDSQNAHTLGRNLTICVGDICFFLGFRAIGDLVLDASIQQQVLTRFSQEYIHVGLGEMHDVTQTAERHNVTADEVLEVYRYKTARYTLVLPLLMAGIVAKISAKEAQKVEELAEIIGLIFQIKDDEMGLFGTEQEIGKPVLSDMREGKKTLYFMHAVAAASTEESQELWSAFGNHALSESQFLKTRELVVKLGAKRQVDAFVQNLQSQLLTKIAELSNEKWRHFFTELVSYNLSRKK